MRTYLFEGTVTALSSIAHNGGEQNGITSQLRREKFVQPNGKAVKVPVISGNAVRGIIRDAGMFHMLRSLGYGVNEETGEVKGLPLPAFYFLFSGGSLTSTSTDGIDVDAFRQMKRLIPLIGLFGGAAGNAIIPGKMRVGKLIPICSETIHLLPESAAEGIEVNTIWEYCQSEMYTRRDDAKNDRLLPMLEQRQIARQAGMAGEAEEGHRTERQGGPQQMMYRVETLAAGLKFYWKVTLEDVTDVEFEAFVATIIEFSKRPYLGGKSAVGHGEVSIKMGKWVEVDSRANLGGKEVDVPLLEKYSAHLKDNAVEIRAFLNSFQ